MQDDDKRINNEIEDLDIEGEAAQDVRGGEFTTDVTVNKAKTADRTYNKMVDQGYLRQ